MLPEKYANRVVLSVLDLCELFGRSRPTVYKLARLGYIPALINIGPNQKGIYTSTLIQHIEQRAVHSQMLSGEDLKE